MVPGSVQAHSIILPAAGWEHKQREDGAVWRNPESGLCIRRDRRSPCSGRVRTPTSP